MQQAGLALAHHQLFALSAVPVGGPLVNTTGSLVMCLVLFGLIVAMAWDEEER